MKPTNKLTELACKKANAVGKKLTDGNGMYLLVHKNGSKYWRMDFRLSGKRKTLAHALEDSGMTDRGHFEVWVEDLIPYANKYTIGLEYVSDYDEVELKKKTSVTYLGPPTEEAALRAATDHELGHRDIEQGEWLD